MSELSTLSISVGDIPHTPIHAILLDANCQNGTAFLSTDTLDRPVNPGRKIR